MKRVAFILLFAGLACLAGCVSSGEFILEEKSPIALVSVVSNWDINRKEEESINPRSVTTSTRRTLRADPELAIVSNAEELINTAETLFRDTIAGSKLISLA
jgi:hypothetical protein